MIDVKRAVEIFGEKYPSRRVDVVVDVPGEWVISGVDAATGWEIDEPPLGISKEDGTTRTFFPPDNREKLAKAVVVDQKLYSDSVDE